MKKFLILITSVVSLCLILNFKFKILNSNTVSAQVAENSWPMAGANPQRTGWTPSEPSSNLHIEWYRPIDAYVPLNFNVIAANNLVYISSSRGLYALAYDTGQEVWRYDTEIPLGNSPTIATVNGTSIAVVGGYDKKLHAFNALNGTPLWEFAGAKAGFDANPLVINNTVYVGNRDGYFYAVSATNGQLVWQYPPANQDGLGAIHLSPAYNNGTIYFATDYNYGYALNVNGTLKWKSQKLVGDGYNSYWPVIYTDTSVTPSKDYVIFSGNMAIREFMRPGTVTYSNGWYPFGYGLNPVSQPITLTDPWAAGKTILDFTPTAKYLEEKPWMRIMTIFDGSTGTEYTTDFDHNGLPEYWPVWPDFNPSTQAPPIVNPNDGLIYVDNSGESGAYVMGWKFGTPYFALTAIKHAGDEPEVISGGGNYLFRDLKNSGIGDYTLFNNLSSRGILWAYDLKGVAPGYDEKLFYTVSYNGDEYGGSYGNVNGIYGSHGDQNPFVSYHGKVYVFRGNAILAFGSGTARGKVPRLTSNSPQQTVTVPANTELVNRLEKEISKIVNAGILKPGYYEDSQFPSSYYLLDNYFDNPGDTLYTLSIAYPYLSSSLQSQVKSYLSNTTNGIFDLYFKNGIINRIGWARGAQRDSIDYPPELAADMSTLPDDYNWQLDGSLSWNFPLYIYTNPNNLYALYKYAQLVNPENVQNIYQLAVNTLTTGRCQYRDCTVVPTWNSNTAGATDAYLIGNPYELNAYLAGYIGFLKLQDLAGKATQDSALRTSMTNEYNRLRNLRLNNFIKDTPYTTYNNGWGKNFINLSRNFIWMTPELAAEMRQSILSQVQSALNEYNTVGPYWFVSRFNAAVAESGFQNLYDYPSNFQARAWILKSSKEELYKYLDTPAFERGDLFYIQNLIATIEAPSSGPSPTSGPTTTPIPPACSSDLNHDHTVNQSDLLLILQNFNSNISSYDINSDGKVNTQDAVYILKNWGGSC